MMRVDRSFACLDLCGFASFTEQRGDDDAVAIVALLRALLRAAADRHGVRVTKWLGDGAMVTGADPLHVAGCATEVRDDVALRSPLPVRGGLARGPVIMFERDDYIGRAVNVAARLADAAAPNQLLASSNVADALDGSIAVRPVPALLIRGLEEPVASFDLGARVGERTDGPQVRGDFVGGRVFAVRS
jgi:adenylate cyclase